MKPILLILVFLMHYSANSQSRSVKTAIIITTTKPYCGGANPTEKMVAESQQKKIPFGETFYIIKGNINSANRKLMDRFVCDSTGRYVVQLKPGCYSIIDTSRLNEIVPTAADEFDWDCLQKNWHTPLFTFKVIRHTSPTFTYNIALPCPHNAPCLKVKKQLRQ